MQKHQQAKNVLDEKSVDNIIFFFTALADELLDCLDYASMGIYSKRAAATAEKESQISFASAGLMRKLFYWSLFGAF